MNYKYEDAIELYFPNCTQEEIEEILMNRIPEAVGLWKFCMHIIVLMQAHEIWYKRKMNYIQLLFGTSIYHTMDGC